MISICDAKIASKGPNVGLSFYAFFANKNAQPELLMEVAQWWIQAQQLDHFEKAVKIRAMLEHMDSAQSTQQAECKKPLEA